MAQEHIKSVLGAANTQTCLNPELRESMRVTALLAASSIKDHLNRTDSELSKKTFAASLKALRRDMGITQSELADICGWSQSRIGNYEKAMREPSFDDVNALAKVFGVLPVHLLFGFDKQK